MKNKLYIPEMPMHKLHNWLIATLCQTMQCSEHKFGKLEADSALERWWRTVQIQPNKNSAEHYCHV